MKHLRIASNLVPVSEFKSRAAECIQRLSETAEPMVITQNGRAAAVLLSPAEYDALTERIRFVEAVEEGLRDEAEGRTSSDVELGRQLKAALAQDRKR